MNTWIPDLSSYTGPVYLAVVEAIETAIRAGRFKTGDMLPPQRMLADFLGLHVNTVNRAMRETARRGLTTGSRRRGTVILRPSARPACGCLYTAQAERSGSRVSHDQNGASGAAATWTAN
jgi:DNA-binding transcriptional regulator YhcF (GntR family)